jgi:alpha-D-ribose 1-methylphosphonate 5-triphosphate synthase subunit PhnH
LPDPVALAANHARYPLGFDTFLAAGERIAGLPRSTRVEAL